MKKHAIVSLVFIFLLPLVAWTASDRTIKTEIITSDKANQDITITPTGTGDVILKAYNGFLKWASGSPTEQASISLTGDVSGTLPVANGGTNSATALNNNFVMISSGGAIVEDSAVSTTELSYLDNVTSNIQTQLNAKEPTLPNTTNGDLLYYNSGQQRLAIGSTGYILQEASGLPSWADGSLTFADLTSTQTIGGAKTFSSDSNWSSTGAIDIPAGTTAQQPGSPSSGMIRFNTDDVRFEGYNGSAWAEIGGGGAGGINYNDNYDIEANADGYSAFDDASAYVDGTGGSPTVTVTRNTTTPRRGNGDLKFTKTSGADYQYEGFSFDISIDKADQAKKLILDFDLDATDTDCVDDALIIRIYDKTNAAIIRGNGEEIKCGDLHHYMQFQTAPDSTEYRISFMYNATDTNEVIYYFDNIKVGPQVIQHGAIVTDWEDYTLSAAGGITLGNATVKSKYRRVGDSIEVRGEVTFGNATSISGDVYFNHPNGLDVDTSKITEVSNSIVGSATLLDSGVENLVGVVTLGADYAIVRYITATGGTSTAVPEHALLSATAPFTWTTNDKIVFEYKVPITGFSSTAKMSEDFSGREIVTSISESFTQSLTDNTTTKVAFTSGANVTEDTVAAWDTTNLRINIKETGYYDLMGGVGIAANAGNIGVVFYKNGSSIFSNLVPGTSLNTNLHRLTAPAQKLEKGDYIELYVYWNDISGSASINCTSGYLSVAKRSSPQTMLENELVAASFNDGSGQSITTGSYNTLTWDTVLVDTHNGMSSGVYTIPVTGNYSISGMAMMEIATVWDGVDYLGIKIYKNGATNLNSIERRPYSGEAYAGLVLPAFVVPLNKGDTIQMQVYQNTPSNRNLLNSDVRNSFTILKVK